MTRYLKTFLIGLALLSGCAPDTPPPRTTLEFLENPNLLEAAMVRCSRDRDETRYDPECMNARAAVQQIQAKEEEASRVDLEVRSERKRADLRRTLEASAEARRRAEELERLREEAEYLAQFGVLPPREEVKEELPSGNLPIAVLPEVESQPQPTQSYGDVLPSTDGGNAPVARPEPDSDSSGDPE